MSCVVIGHTRYLRVRVCRVRTLRILSWTNRFWGLHERFYEFVEWEPVWKRRNYGQLGSSSMLDIQYMLEIQPYTVEVFNWLPMALDFLIAGAVALGLGCMAMELWQA